MEEKEGLKPEEELEGEIASIAYGGDGILRINNFVLFVPDVIPGERVRVKVCSIARTFGRARLVQVLVSSPDRVTPPCPVYGLCGGCQYQHIRYERALAIKEAQTAEVLERIGGIRDKAIYRSAVPCPKPYGYRGTVTFRVRTQDGKWELGFIARDNATFVPVSACPIASPAINGHLSRILEELGTLEASEFVEAVTVKESEEGILRTFHYRRPYRFKTTQKGTYHLEGLRLAYGLSSFFQVNHAMIPQLVAEVREAMNPAPEDVLFDCYAGTGLFSLALSRNVSCSVGIESNREAAGHFEKNVRDNHLRNVRIGRGRAEALLQPLFRTFGKKGRCLLLLDPPREGLASELIQAMKALDFRKICYVSCEVSHLARDLKRLGPSYRLEQVRSLDLFPQTQYLETAAILEKTDSK